jgi:hypothetical protein
MPLRLPLCNKGESEVMVLALRYSSKEKRLFFCTVLVVEE